jgi:hypothetical protein
LVGYELLGATDTPWSKTLGVRAVLLTRAGDTIDADREVEDGLITHSLGGDRPGLVLADSRRPESGEGRDDQKKNDNHGEGITVDSIESEHL